MMMVCGPGWGPGGKGVMTGEVTSERDRGTKHTHFQKQGRLEKEKTGGGGEVHQEFYSKNDKPEMLTQVEMSSTLVNLQM